MFKKIDYGEFNETMRTYIALSDKDKKQAYLTLLKKNKELENPLRQTKTFNNINDDYKIEASDDLNVTLFKKRIVKSGENKGQVVWNPIAYTPNVKMALETLVNKEINGTGIKDFNQVVARVDELMEQIKHFKVTYVKEREIRDE